ncbi:MAG: DUF2461 domain-containing protein [Cyclobacteriaceae bacterium]
MITKQTLAFLRKLRKNNNREWFQDNKAEYEKAHSNMIAFAEALHAEMQTIDNLVPTTGKKSLMRIYRDVRFSKDKTPYKSNFGGGFKRATEALRGSYYYHVAPTASFVGGGFWGPNSDDLKLIRSHIAAEPDRLRAIINSNDFQKEFGKLKGEKVKTAPKGYAKDDPAIDLLRYKQFLVSRSFTDEEITDENFYKEAAGSFARMRPFLNYMSEILTTDLNGIPLI